MAVPGYGKRSASGQASRTPADFMHLPAREAAVASYIDRLPEGADISVKTLAKVLPYGQCALRTALNFLQRAGHLRRGREGVHTGCDGIRWVTRTWFTRTARDDGWWAAYAVGAAASEERSEAASVPLVEDVSAGPAIVAPALARTVPSPRAPVAERSPAYGVLAALGRRNACLTLSADDCEALEPLAAEWFARGWGVEDVARALTDGLPFPVHHAAGLVRKRLVAKLPPELPPEAGLVTVRRVIECGTCGKPAPPECLLDGDCGVCRGEQAPTVPVAALPPERVRALAARVRDGVRNAEQSVEPVPVRELA